MVALTKTDLSAEASELEGIWEDGIPVIPISSVSGTNIDRLKRLLSDSVHSQSENTVKEP